MEWSVRFEISRPGLVFTEDHADEIMEALGAHSPAVSYSAHALAARFCVEANSYRKALLVGFTFVNSALKHAGIKSAQGRIIEFEAQELSSLDRSLEEANMPELFGVAEISKVAKVSRQRISQLVRSRSFPRPVATLATGPIWYRGTITRFIKSWARRPGRPRKTARTST